MSLDRPRLLRSPFRHWLAAVLAVVLTIASVERTLLAGAVMPAGYGHGKVGSALLSSPEPQPNIATQTEALVLETSLRQTDPARSHGPPPRAASLVKASVDGPLGFTAKADFGRASEDGPGHPAAIGSRRVPTGPPL